jgi:hypothetical protein
MPLELKEFTEIVDGDWPHGPNMQKRPTPEELQRSIQLLLTRQCIYSWLPNLGRLYDIITHYSPFFERYFGAAGYVLRVHPNEQMVAIEVPHGQSRYDTVYERLRKDETQVLLIMRLMWEEAIGRQDIAEGGVAETTTGDLIDRYKTIIQQEPPEENRLMEILRHFSRKGGVKIGVTDRIDRVTPITLLPGVSILVPDGFVDDLRLWAASPAPAETPLENPDQSDQAA